MLGRKPRKLAAVALANKNGRHRVGRDDERGGVPAAARRLGARLPRGKRC